MEPIQVKHVSDPNLIEDFFPHEVPPQTAVTDKPGSDGVYLWVNNYLGLAGADRIKTTKLVKVMRWVTDQYAVEKRTTAISDHEMIDLVKTHLPDRYEEAVKQGRAGGA